jgi:hypothetical protein
MKLSQAGSLVNFLQANATRGQPKPKPGMGATVLHYSDRSPATIVKVWDDAHHTYVEVQGDRYTRIDSHGMSEMQDYTYERDRTGPISTWRFDGKTWVRIVRNPTTGRWNQRPGEGLRIGEREKYHDFTF